MIIEKNVMLTRVTIFFVTYGTVFSFIIFVVFVLLALISTTTSESTQTGFIKWGKCTIILKDKPCSATNADHFNSDIFDSQIDF